MKRALVTGATGFVGRQTLAPLAERGYELHAVARSIPANSLSPAEWHAADLLAPREAERVVEDVRPTHLLHLAWYAVHREYWSSPENDRWVEASRRLVDRFRELGGLRAVCAGTCAEYDWSAGVCIEEETPLAPRGRYGEAKNRLRESIEAPGLAWARIFFPYGPHEHPERLVASVVRALLRGEPAALSEGSQRRDFIHVADAGAALAAILDSAVDGPVNVGTGEAPSVRELAERAAELVGRPELLRFGAPIDEPPLVVADPRRLRNEVGWTPSLSLEDGLAATTEWWRSA